MMDKNKDKKSKNLNDDEKLENSGIMKKGISKNLTKKK